MSGFDNKNCSAQFEKSMPKQPWGNHPAETDFEPLRMLIDAHTQADMFRHQGKYQTSEDYYELGEGKSDAKNGIVAEVTKVNGGLSALILEDKSAGLK